MTSEGEETGEQIDPVDILLVEPNPGDTRLFTENLQEAKFTNNIHTVSNGEAALDFLHQRDEYADAPCPDLILLEPQLPDISGMEVLSVLEDDPVLNEVPVIILTSSDVGEDIVKSHGLDADHYIRKPVEPEDFIEFVQSVEDFWLALVQQQPADD